MNKTRINYLDYTWNPTHGCSPVDEGCLHCWAETMAKRLAGMGINGYDKDDPFKVVCCPEKLNEPLRVKKPSRIGIVFMGDLYHEKTSPMYRRLIFNTIEKCPQHTFLILTKRVKNMADELCQNIMFMDQPEPNKFVPHIWPNAWLGATVASQQNADERIPILLQIPAAVRFVSIEPTISPVDLCRPYGQGVGELLIDYLNWCIVGCESGPGRRPCEIEWIRSLIGQCQDAGVPFFLKQLSIKGKVSHNPEEWPEDLRIRELPNAENG